MSNQLVVTNNGTPATTSRIIAEEFGKLHKDVLRKIDNMPKDEFSGRNFTPTNYIDEQGKERPEYIVTRDGFTELVMSFTGEKARAKRIDFIKAFNILEENYNNQIIKPVEYTKLEWMKIAIESETARVEAENKRILLEHQVEVLEPKADVYDLIAETVESKSPTEVAKYLNLSPKKLFDWLHANGWTYKNTPKGKWLPYQSKINAGLLELKYTQVGEMVYPQTLITVKGLLKLASLNIAVQKQQIKIVSFLE